MDMVSSVSSLPQEEETITLSDHVSLGGYISSFDGTVRDDDVLASEAQNNNNSSGSIPDAERGVSVGAEGHGKLLDSGFIAIRARVSDDVDDEDEEEEEDDDDGEDEGEEGDNEDEEASNESYDSALERIAIVSTPDMASPVGSFTEFLPFSEPNSIKFNQLNAGMVSSVDSSIINTRAMPVAKPTIEDEDDTDALDDAEDEANVGASDLDYFEEEGDLISYSARGLPVRGAEYESEEVDDSSLAPHEEGNSTLNSKQSVALGMIAGEDQGGIDSEQNNRGIVLSLAENDLDSHEQVSYANDQLLDVKEPTSELVDSVTFNSSDDIDLNTGHDYPDSTPKDDLQDVLPEVTSKNKEDSAQSENSELEKKLSTCPAEEDEVLKHKETEFLEMSGILDEKNVRDSEQELESSNEPEAVQDVKIHFVDVEEKDVKDGIEIEDLIKVDAGKEGQEEVIEANLIKEGKEDVIETIEGKKVQDFEAYNSNNNEVENDGNDAVGEGEGEGDDEDDEDVDDEHEFAMESSSLLDAFVSSNSSEARATDMRSLGGAGPSLPIRPAGLGRSMPSLDHAPRSLLQQRSSGSSSMPISTTENEPRDSNEDLSEAQEDAQKKLQMIRVKFLRLAHRLGQSANNVVVAQVLYRLGLAEQLRRGQTSGRGGGAFSFERASALAEEQEAAGQDDLEFGCTIMVLGKSGVGKSATINSLFDESKSITNAYSPATKKVQIISGTVHGIKLRVIDTPGLLTSFADQRHNEKIMSSVKRFIKRSPPDMVLYFDRLDMPCRDYGDLPLLRTITDTFGAAVWFNAIVVLTHASSAPPDGANGVPVSYEMFVAQRSHVVQQTIRQAAGDMRLMNPVSLVENHSACRKNRAGQYVLPNGHVWKPQLLLLCFASKILAEANSLLKLQEHSPIKPFGARPRVPPLPFLLSSLLQSRAQLKLPDEQIDDDVSDSDEESDSDDEEEYDDLPPFRRLTRAELSLLDKEQRKIYQEELEYREKLFMKKQLKEERLRKKELKKRLGALPKEVSDYVEEELDEETTSGAIAVPMPDMALPPSFDSDNPAYRYRYLDTANQWLVRPVLETHGWDHDSGYDGLNIEKTFVISKKIPASLSGQITKDKKEGTVQMETNAAFKNGNGKVTLAGVDIQTIGKDLGYTLRSETRFDNFKRNRTSCGLAVTMLGDAISAGMKLEDKLTIGKQCKLVLNGGAMTGRGDVAYGGSLEASVRAKDYPIEQTFSTLGLSLMNWHGDVAVGGNLQIQFKVGQTLVGARGNLNNRGTGQITIRANSSEQVQMALIALIPLLRTCLKRVLSSGEGMQ